MGNYNPVATGGVAGYTGSTVANVYLAAEYLISRVSDEAAQKVNIFPKVWVENLQGTEAMVAHFRFLDALSAAGAATEGSALPVVAWSPEGVAVTAGLDGLSIQVSKTFNGIAIDALDRIAGQIGTSLGRAIDTAIAALFPSLTAGTVGTSGAALVLTDIMQAEANLDKNYAIGPRYGIVHSQAFFNLKKDMKAANFGIAKITADATGNEQIVIGGVTVEKNNLMASINSNADYAGAVFVQDALGCSIAKTPNVEILSIPGYDAYSVDGTVAFGAGVIRPLFGSLVRSGKSAS